MLPDSRDINAVSVHVKKMFQNDKIESFTEVSQGLDTQILIWL